MKPDKLRELFKKDRPDLDEVEVPVEPARSAALPADVNERAAAESTWAGRRPRAAKRDRSQSLSSDDIKQAFAPRELGANLAKPDSAAGDKDEPAIVRGAKKRPYAADAADDGGQGPGVKDFIVDEKRGIIGSQG